MDHQQLEDIRRRLPRVQRPVDQLTPEVKRELWKLSRQTSLPMQTLLKLILDKRSRKEGIMKHIGLDVGTKNIILAYRDAEGKTKFKREVNGFIVLEKADNFARQMLKMQKVPFVEREGQLVALGAKAEEIAYTFGVFLRRPMEEGVLSVGEEDAMKIVSSIIKGIVGKLQDDTTLYYCVPAPAVNAPVNVQFHQKIVQAIVDSYKSDDGHRLIGHPINEARAIVLSQIEDKTGIGVSFGAGMVNISYCLFGLPVYEFSIVGSGDWVDMESARVTGNLEADETGRERPRTLVTRAKEALDLNAEPTSNLTRAIKFNYQTLIENVAENIISGFMKNESKARAPKPMPIVIAGGTSSPPGFLEMFRQVFQSADMPFEVGEVSRANEPLYAVAEGCLIASEFHDEE